MPGFSHVLYDAGNLFEGKLSDRAPAPDAVHNLIQPGRPSLLLQLAHQPEFLSQGKLFDQRGNIDRDCDVHHGKCNYTTQISWNIPGRAGSNKGRGQ